MWFNYPLVLFSGFLCVLAVVAVPEIVYRGDDRSPAEIKKSGGFRTRASTNGFTPKGTIFDHVNGPGNDRYSGFISCTASVIQARKSLPDKWAYYINPKGGKYVDVAAEFAKTKQTYGHREEQEWASEGDIPWLNIIQWEKLSNKKVVSTETRLSFDNPTKIPKQPSGPPAPKPAAPSDQPPSKIPKKSTGLPAPKPAPPSNQPPNKIPKKSTGPPAPSRHHHQVNQQVRSQKQTRREPSVEEFRLNVVHKWMLRCS